MKCSFVGCKSKALHVWDACADTNKERGICAFHDAFINLMFMSAVRPRNWRKKLKKYIDFL